VSGWSIENGVSALIAYIYGWDTHRVHIQQNKLFSQQSFSSSVYLHVAFAFSLI